MLTTAKEICAPHYGSTTGLSGSAVFSVIILYMAQLSENMDLT